MLKFMKDRNVKSAAKVETAANSASSASGGALFKEDMPRRKSSVEISDIFKNMKHPPEPDRKGLEYGEDNTLMGRLGARMASRDFIDKLNLGSKPVAKTVDTADNDFRPEGGVRTLFNDPAKHEDGLDVLSIPERMRHKSIPGMGRHQQVIDFSAFNSSDAIKAGDYRDTSAIEGSNMADQAHAQGNVFGKKLEVQKGAIPGGLAENKGPEDFDREKLNAGAKIESEHTSDPKVAKEISMDHLTEDINYYEKLKKLHL